MEDNTLHQPVDTPAIPIRALMRLVTPQYPDFTQHIRNLPEDVVNLIHRFVGEAYEAGFAAATFCARAQDREVPDSIPLHRFVDTLQDVVSDVPKWAYDEGFEWSGPDFEDTLEWWQKNVWDYID